MSNDLNRPYQKSSILLLKIGFHLAPVIPFIYGKIYFGIAIILLVALTYIKTFKIKNKLMEASLRSSGSKESDKEINGYKKNLNFWSFLTFVP